MTKQLKIKLVKSCIGRLPKHIAIVRQLGLRKLNSEVVHHDIPAIRGLLSKISYLITVEDCK